MPKAILFLSLIMLAVTASACQQNSSANVSDSDSSAVAADTVVAPAPQLPLLVGDSTLTSAARYIAKLVDESASYRTLDPMDSLFSADMPDLRKRCNYVYYPFSGPDFLYPFRLFPDADTYFLLGLEKPGSPISVADTTVASKVKVYSRALSVYFKSSFFRTNSMKGDLSNETIDGTVPVLTMLMTKKDCEIISVRYMQLDADGNMSEAAKQTDLAEIRFFQRATPTHEQVLYYYSGNVADAAFPAPLLAYLNTQLSQPGREVCTFLKAASYLMHKSYFSKIRNTILDHSFAVLQDDSGIPYRHFTADKWKCTLYGKYMHPIRIFAELTMQHDLDSIYRTSPEVRELPFRIGYNSPSNWMVARRQAN